MTRLHPKYVYLAGFISLIASQPHAQETLFEKFAQDSQLAINITTDWNMLWEIRDDTEQEAVLEVFGKPMEVELRLRGRARRRTCDIKPFRINFKNKDLEEQGFPEFDKFKVVTPCLAVSEGVKNVYEEYLVYKMYNLITDESFRVHLFELTMSWPEDSKKPKTRTCFLIEPNEELAARVGGPEIEQFGVSPDSLNVEAYNRTALFQFMIGNFDWQLSVMQNIKTIRTDDKFKIVPYDFDYSNIVMASYRRIPAGVGITNPLDRSYKGEYFYDELPSTRAHFLSKRDEILALVENFELLSKGRRRQIARYLEDFFKLLEDDSEKIELGYVLRGVP